MKCIEISDSKVKILCDECSASFDVDRRKLIENLKDTCVFDKAIECPNCKTTKKLLKKTKAYGLFEKSPIL